MQNSGKWQGDKKTFLNETYQEIEENNRMEKTVDLFKKIADTKGTFHEKMGSIKDRNSKNLTGSDDIKKELARIHRRAMQERS